jgi:glucose/arabinose dehydrogenase
MSINNLSNRPCSALTRHNPIASLCIPLWSLCLCGSILLLLILAPAVSLAQDSPPYVVERLHIANYPVALAFAPDGRLFYTEKAAGSVRVILSDGTLQPDPVLTLPVDSLVERGLLGLTFDPGYAENGFIWIVRTAPGTARDYPTNQIIRFREQDGIGSDPQVMFSAPITTGELHHNGGNLHFDSDGLLYASFGDYGLAANAQDLTTVPGKIHRFAVTDDGLIPAPGNPFLDSSIYAYGLRNPFDFVLDPFSKAIFASENGPKCDDEIDLILPGRNYGWGEHYGDQCFGLEPVDVPDYLPPLISFRPTIGMGGITVYAGDAFPDWTGSLFFCDWNGGVLHRVTLDESRTAITQIEPVDLQGFFCRIDVITGPDGALYFADPMGIYRLRPISPG